MYGISTIKHFFSKTRSLNTGYVNLFFKENTDPHDFYTRLWKRIKNTTLVSIVQSFNYVLLLLLLQ